MASQEINIIINAIDKYSKYFDGLSNKLSGIKKQAEKVTKIVGAIGVGTVGLSISEFSNFEKQMSKVKAITGANEEEFKKLNDIAKQMGATTAFTGKEAGEALEFLGMAGLSVKESMDALPGTLQLASAANMDLGNAADIATNIMAQFRIEAKDIGRVNDVLAKSATSANTSVEEMAEAMKYMGPVASSLGVDIEETASAINVLANNGIKGGMAGQSFSSSLLRITNPSKQAAESIEELNLQLFNQKGQYVGITGTVKQLEKSMQGLTDKEKAAHIAKIFGTEATKQWLTLLKEGSGELENYTEKLDNAEGTAKKMADTQLDNLAGSFTLLKSAISGLLIDIGYSLSTYLRPAIDGLTKFLSNFKENWENLSPAMKNIIKLAGSIAVGFLGIVTVLGTISMVLPIITGGIGLLTGTISILIKTVGVLSKAMMFLTMNPMGLIITAIAAVVAAGVLLYKNWDVVKEKLSELGKFFIMIWNGISDFISKICLDISNFLSGIWTKIKDNIAIIWGNIASVATAIWTTFKETITGIWNGILDGATEIFTNIKDNIISLFQSAIKFATDAWEKVQAMWRKAKKAGKEIADVATGGFAQNAGAATRKWIDKNILGVGKAYGGNVKAGGSYMVGERGRELFIPETNGRIVSNDKIGGNTISISISGNYIGDQADEERLANKVIEKLNYQLQISKFGIS